MRQPTVRDNSYISKAFLIRYCDEIIHLEEAVVFRIEVRGSTPYVLINVALQYADTSNEPDDTTDFYTVS